MGFRENLREALDYSGLGQKELAYKANVKLRSIENYLREDASIPMADKAVQIAQALGVTVEYLVTGKNSSDTYIDPEIRKLARVIKKLPKNKQPIVIKNAIHLAETLSK
ncbi:MAG: helix-turn-helix domain-containing protein [Treponema sp.]|nr:helix-turn-helix domain-containing protein [Treponema sp.]